jgi:hypothetical protein
MRSPQVDGSVRKALGIAGLCAAALIAQTNSAAKMDFRACKFRVMQDPRYRGKSRDSCDVQCVAAIKRCMASGGKTD